MMEALRLMHAGFPTRCPYEDLYDRYKDIMPRSIAALDSPSFCEILLMALGLDKNDYQLGITKIFFRAGKLAFLDELTGSEYKELAGIYGREDIGVIFCGAPMIAAALKSSCEKLSNKEKTVFRLHKENF